MIVQVRPGNSFGLVKRGDAPVQHPLMLPRFELSPYVGGQSTEGLQKLVHRNQPQQVGINLHLSDWGEVSRQVTDKWRLGIGLYSLLLSNLWRCALS
jgi:hypothetical protein